MIAAARNTNRNGGASAGGALARVRAVAGVALCAFALGTAAQTPAAPAAPAKPKATKPAKKPADTGFRMVVQPEAMALLRATSEKLAAAKTLQFTAVASYEYPSRLGPPIVYTMRYDVTMQRPDKLRILVPGDGPASEFYYDGKTMVAYAPAENLAAVADAPPTVDAALLSAFKTAGIYFPFVDLLAADPYQALTDGVQLAFTVGPSGIVGGVKTDMVVWANADVFLQIWIGADDKLPRRVRAMYRADPLGLRHEMELTNWQLDAPVAQDFFVATRAQGAGRMPFKAPGPPAKTMKPLAAGKAGAAPAKKQGAQ
ncbi:MAG TPA: DUF2092 domain-containing protein [Casimicrobiaceae bacterium]